MKKITVISVGALKETLAQAAGEYTKRLSGLCDYKEIVLKEAYAGNESGAECAAALEKEADAILSKLPRSAWKVALCVEGRQRSSEVFSKELEDVFLSFPEAVFIIGSSHGLSERLKAECDRRLSMSEMTFPHQIAKLMLLEQLYRFFCISGNKKYHK